LKLPPVLHQCLIFWAVLCLFLVFYTDFQLPALLHQSDYLMTFHCAGYIASHGLWSSLYPGPDAVSFVGTPFDKQAHALLNQMPHWSVAEYMYMPLSAYIFAPYSLLSPTASLIAWQLTSLASLFAGNWLTLGKLNRALLATCASFTFIPLVFTLWIGQVGLVFGLLPLAGGYYLLNKKRYVAGGLILALLTLKPQMLVPAIFMVALTLTGKNFRTLLGFVIGGLVIAGLNYLLAGPVLCQQWLACLALSDKVYSDPAHGVAVHLATSLPRAILLSQPQNLQTTIKPVLYTFSGLLLLAGLFSVWKLGRSRFSAQTKLRYTFALGALALPCIVPHLFLYDLGALVPAAMLFFFADKIKIDSDAEEEKMCRSFKILMASIWLCLTIYCLALVISKNLASPLLIVAIMLALYLRALAVILAAVITDKADIQNSESVQ